MLRIVGRRWAIYPVVAGIVAYALLAGAEPPVVRAAIMGILYVWAIHLGRESTAVVSLSAAGLVLTAINPLALWDVGFQLSTAGTFGLIALTPLLSQRSRDLVDSRNWPEWGSNLALWVIDPLIVTIAAQVATLPILLAYFGRLSTVALLSNLLIAATQPPILALGGLALITGLIWAPLGMVFAVLPWLLLAYTVKVVQLAARVPNASVDVGRVNIWFVWCYYGLLVGTATLVGKWSEVGQRARTMVKRAVIVTAAALLCVWLGVALASSLPDGLLHVWYIGLGESDVVLVQTPSGRNVLIDAGEGDSDAASAVRHALRGWKRRLDLLILTQDSEKSQAGAESVLSRLPVERVLARGGTIKTLSGQSTTAPSKAWLVEPLLPNTTITLDDDVTLEVLHAPEASDEVDRAALRLSWGQMHLLLPSDIEQFTQETLLQSGLDLHSTVLKTPHQGTGNWPKAQFLEAARPQLILMPNDTTYPPASVNSLSTRPLQLVEPLETVEIQSDGAEFWFEKRSGQGWLWR
jgi:competence protein ComEC